MTKAQHAAYYRIKQNCLAKGMPLKQATFFAYLTASQYTPLKNKQRDPVKCQRMCEADCSNCMYYNKEVTIYG